LEPPKDTAEEADRRRNRGKTIERKMQQREDLEGDQGNIEKQSPMV
jgi:hypothetical protein